MTRISALIAAALSASGAQAYPHAPRQANASWPGFAGLQYWFSFGDSYTQTGFDVSSTQPSAENPFGNPTYPGWTSSNGPNWVGYLTYKYNASLLQTYNLAYGGATVDSDLVAPYADTVISLKQQIQDEYLPKYGADGASKVWQSDNTLFSVWIGINDVGNSYWSQNSTLIDAIFTEYSGLVDQLYTSGARNFLFLNVPPLERTPLTTGQGSDSINLEKPAVVDFNDRISNLASSLQEKHTDATVFQFDAHTLFNKILDDPSSYTQTAGLKNTTGYCADYENGTDEQNTTIAACGAAVNEYFWLNSLHPTFPVHEAVASELSKQLSACANCTSTYRRRWQLTH
ncbi:Lipase GDSL [Lasiodiplodia theobromae]|uniref:Acetylesterase n=1 Tax=Lasiodiplodia theobromae TaxID=45133 RepID=A0A5N5D3A1_9PEZI|nr:Acetylesterase [Lasiodiplodia theobromae]KAF9632311.1 Lipase GDSL [Lasiodiplodia theobromae]